MSKTSIEWLSEARVSDCRTSGDTMGSRYTARFHAAPGADIAAIVAALAAAVTAVDRQMSNWKADSDLSRLNRAAPQVWTAIPRNLVTVLTRAVEIGRETDNAFNIGVGDLVDAWGFGPGGRPGRAGEVAAAPRAPIDNVLEIDAGACRARKHGPLALDLCGIAKGFGVDEPGADAVRVQAWTCAASPRASAWTSWDGSWTRTASAPGSSASTAKCGRGATSPTGQTGRSPWRRRTMSAAPR
jgi:FAD:protein FMN transferase